MIPRDIVVEYKWKIATIYKKGIEFSWFSATKMGRYFNRIKKQDKLTRFKICCLTYAFWRALKKSKKLKVNTYGH